MNRPIVAGRPDPAASGSAGVPRGPPTVHVDRVEERAFWDWAVIETLGLSIRIEELLEISQLSIRQYLRPNGEVVAMLVIAPSRTARERVIPMSAELSPSSPRHARGPRDPGGGPLRPARAGDLPPLPYLFQRPGTPARP